jgi:hypothetical protein
MPTEFLTLPAEIRLKIASFVFVRITITFISDNQDDTYDEIPMHNIHNCTVTPYNPLVLLRVCKQLKREAQLLALTCPITLVMDRAIRDAELEEFLTDNIRSRLDEVVTEEPWEIFRWHSRYTVQTLPRLRFVESRRAFNFIEVPSAFVNAVIDTCAVRQHRVPPALFEVFVQRLRDNCHPHPPLFEQGVAAGITFKLYTTFISSPNPIRNLENGDYHEYFDNDDCLGVEAVSLLPPTFRVRSWLMASSSSLGVPVV